MNEVFVAAFQDELDKIAAAPLMNIPKPGAVGAATSFLKGVGSLIKKHPKKAAVLGGTGLVTGGLLGRASRD